MTLDQIGKDDGLPVVRGVIASTGADRDGQTMNRDWLARALREWFNGGGTVTTNFDKTPVAKCTHLFTEDGGLTFQGDVVIIDKITAQLVADDVLRGLSVGIAKAKISVLNNPSGDVIDGRITDVSFLDHDYWSKK